MTIRFLRTTASESPDYPFQAGQTIAVAKLTAEMRAWLKNGDAEVVKDAPELATVVDAERAVTR
jgi:hypothetical protein